MTIKKQQNRRSRKKPTVLIIGARLEGQAGVVLDTLNVLGGSEVIGFVDNDPSLQGKKILGIPVVGYTKDLLTMNLSCDYAHIAITDNIARAQVYDVLKQRKIDILTILHPTAVISREATVREGSFIGPRAVVSHNVSIGEVSIVNSGAVVEHHTVIGKAVSVEPGAKIAGRARINDYAFIGIGAIILPDIKVGSAAMIGAGAVVDQDVSAKKTVFGYATKKHGKNIYGDTKPDVGISTAKVYVAQPTLPEYPLLDSKFREIAKSLMLSNFARYSTELETEVESMLGVGKALTFPNATSALMLALKAMDLKGEVILPSFTFSATGHAVIWNGLTPVFADIRPDTFNIDPKDVQRKITSKTSAIIGVHCFGCPADIETLEAIAQKYKLKLIFDSAHALGSKYKGKPIGGFGDIELFSLSGTKVVTSAEGGIATSNDKAFMQKMHVGRNYGAGSDYNCEYIGLNGKMSEFHAAIALESMALIDEMVEKRLRLAQIYKRHLSEIPGITFQYVPDYCVTTFKDYAVLIDPVKFGATRDELVAALSKEHIYTKKYFFPQHWMKAYKSVTHRAEGLKVTEHVADNIICLPMYSHMNEDTLEKVCFAVYRIHHACRNQKSGKVHEND